MKFLSPHIAKLAKKSSEKKLAKLNVSCGIFQDLGTNTNSKKYRQQLR